MNKKADAKIIVDIWAYVLFVLLICFFLLIIMFSKKTSDLQLNDFTEQADADYALMTYLRSPVPDMNMDFGQFILLVAEDNKNNNIYDYVNLWKTKTKEFMGMFCKKDNCEWETSIIINGKEIKAGGGGSGKESEIKLPSDEEIKVKMIYNLKK
jgi:hypothetical protein